MAVFNLYGSTVPATLNNAVANYTLGTKFQSSVAGNVLGVRFYKSTGDTGTHIGTLWPGTAGAALATVTFTGETASGWQYMAFASPYGILAATTYIVSVHHTTQRSYTTPSVISKSLLSPISTAASQGQYINSVPDAFPTTNSDYWYGIDLSFDDLGNFVPPTGQRDLIGRQCVVGALQGVCIGDLTSINGDTFDRHLQVGVREELVDGYPSPPCLALDIPGFWRFRWQLNVGSQSISIWAKQVSNVAGHRPTMMVKANKACGLNADVVATAGSSTGWIKLGPLTIVATAPGVVYVELRNNDVVTFQSPCYWDNLGT